MFLLQLVILQIIIFGAVIFFLKKIMYGDTESAVNRLNAGYEEMNKKKEELLAAMKKIEEDSALKKQESEKAANQIRNDAEKEAREKADTIIKKAREEAERITTETITLKGKMREDIRKEEDIKIIDFMTDVLKDIFSDTVREKMDNVLIENFLGGFKNMDMSHIPPGVTEIEIVTRSKLSAEVKAEIMEAIKNTMNKTFAVKESVDGGIIGGVIIKFGSLILDGSLLNKFNEVATVKKQKIDEKM